MQRDQARDVLMEWDELPYPEDWPADRTVRTLIGMTLEDFVPAAATTAAITIEKRPAVVAYADDTFFVLTAALKEEGRAEVSCRSTRLAVPEATMTVTRSWDVAAGQQQIVSSWSLPPGTERAREFDTRRWYRDPPEGLELLARQIAHDLGWASPPGLSTSDDAPGTSTS